MDENYWRPSTRVGLIDLLGSRAICGTNHSEPPSSATCRRRRQLYAGLRLFARSLETRQRWALPDLLDADGDELLDERLGVGTVDRILRRVVGSNVAGDGSRTFG